jgi:flagellin-specific chaperone FliS
MVYRLCLSKLSQILIREDGSQIRLEMNKLYSNLMNQLDEQLTKDEIENILNT